MVLKATLYDKNDKKLASFNAKYEIKHKLMPKEITSFKVNFEDIAWVKNTDVKPKTFNPNEFTPLELTGNPVTFDIQCAGNVAITDLYTQVALSDFAIENNHITGTLFNFGIQESTIPEIIGFLLQQQQRIDLCRSFLYAGRRSCATKKYFDYNFFNLNNCKTLKSSLQNCFVNGLANASIIKSGGSE